MIDQLNASISNERKVFRGGDRANEKGWRGMVTYFKFGIVMVAALMALVV